MAKANSSTPSRRATLFGAAALASVAVSASAKASPVSPAIQRAFDDWQAADAHYKACEADDDGSYARFDAMVPGRDSWKRPLSADHQAAIEAALELSGHKATEKASAAAFDAEHAAFLQFIGTPAATLADVQFQAKHLLAWTEDGSELDPPVALWFETLTEGGVA